MSDYLTYTLWRQREARLPRELERQRVAQERLDEQRRELSREPQLREESALDAELDAVAEPSEVVNSDDVSGELDLELISQ